MRNFLCKYIVRAGQGEKQKYDEYRRIGLGHGSPLRRDDSLPRRLAVSLIITSCIQQLVIVALNTAKKVPRTISKWYKGVNRREYWKCYNTISFFIRSFLSKHRDHIRSLSCGDCIWSPQF